MLLMRDNNTYAVLQDNLQRVVELKLGGKITHHFAYCDLQNITFGCWRALHPEVSMEYSNWEIVKQSNELKVLKRAKDER